MDEMIESIKSSIVKKPGIPIRKGDLCFFMMPGSIGTPRNESVVTTKTGPGIGIRIPITKHFGLGISKRKVTTTIKNEIKWDKKIVPFICYVNPLL